jgi:phage gp29-like protein
MAKAAKKRSAPLATTQPELETEAASRLLDPFESDYMGVLRSNDPLLLEKGQNLEIYRDLKRDGKVFSCLQRRIGALVGRPWAVEPVREEDAADGETLTDLLKLFNFDQLCRDLLDAILMGFSVVEIIWGVLDGHVVPLRLAKRRQRRFVYVQGAQDDALQLRLLTKENMLTGIELPEKKFIVHRVNPEDDNPYGTGLGLQIFWAVFFKRKGVVSWAKLCDRFGSPTMWGKYPRNALQKEKNTLGDALRAFSSDGYVMTPEGSTIEMLESKLGGNITTQEALVNAMNDWIAEVAIGQEPRATGGGAIAAASKERSSVRLDLVQADSDLLSETLNRTLIAWLCEYNGLAPCLVYRQIKEEEDKKAESETDKNVSEMGFELSEEAVRTKYGEGWSKKKTAPADTHNRPPHDPAVDDPKADKKPASFAEPEPGHARDKLDQLIDDESAQWSRVIAPMVNPLQALFDEAAANGETAAEVIERLPSVLAKMDTAALASSLGELCFRMRLAGNAGLELDTPHV